MIPFQEAVGLDLRGHENARRIQGLQVAPVETDQDLGITVVAIS
jgi:hypothetical protein